MDPRVDGKFGEKSDQVVRGIVIFVDQNFSDHSRQSYEKWALDWSQEWLLVLWRMNDDSFESNPFSKYSFNWN